jgi:hypothetical protein
MSRVSRAFRISGKIIKYFFILLIVAINAFFLWRIFSSNDPSSMKALSPNEALFAAYETDGDLVGMFSQEQRSITSGEENYGLFAVTNAVFIPSANQIQVTVRYNNSTLRRTQEKYNLSEVPAREDDVFDVSLLIVTDLTPDNKDDNLSVSDDAVKQMRISPSYCEKDQKNLYNFRRFVFDLGDLDLKQIVEDGTLISVFTDIYYAGDADYEKTPYGTLCLYDYITETYDVKLSSVDKKAIEDWKSKK